MLLYQIEHLLSMDICIKNHARKINLTYQFRYGMKRLSYQIDHILYQIFKIPLKYLKNHRKSSANPATTIYVNKNENRIMLKIKATY